MSKTLGIAAVCVALVAGGIAYVMTDKSQSASVTHSATSTTNDANPSIVKANSEYLFPFKETDAWLKSGNAPKSAVWVLTNNFGDNLYYYRYDEGVKFIRSTRNLQECAVATLRYEEFYDKYVNAERSFLEEYKMAVELAESLVHNNRGKEGITRGVEFARKVDKQFIQRQNDIIDFANEASMMRDVLKDRLLACEKRIVIACWLKDPRLMNDKNLSRVCVDKGDQYRYFTRFGEFKKRLYDAPSTWKIMTVFDRVFVKDDNGNIHHKRHFNNID